MTSFDLDQILLSIGGWGYFQTLNYFCLCLVVIFSVFPLSYIFVARDTKYRCKILNYDEEPYQFNPEWLKSAVPYKENIPSRCLYYKLQTSNNTCTSFDTNVTLRCNDFIFENNQTTIVQDFNITCDENLWKLTMAGTLNALGEIFCLPLAGFISDRFGRRNMIIISVSLSTVIGLVRSFSSSYEMYIALQFLDTALGSGMYSGAFILALEIVDAKKRNLGNTILCLAFSLGQMFIGVSAWLSPTWRIMTRTLYSSGIFIVLTLFLIPESVRWLVSKKQTEKAYNVLKLMAKVNRSNLEDTTIMENQTQNSCENRNKEASVFTVLRNKTLLLRTLRCSYIWISCIFYFYGLTIHSLTLSDDVYINFIYITLIEVPATIITQGLMDCLGRRKTQAFSLIFAGISSISANFVDTEAFWISLAVFLCGKFFITVAYTVIYIYTVEMFPTESRNSILSICSTFGRIGTVLAPQIPLLAKLYTSLPLIIFSVTTLTSGFLTFWLPETYNTKLPEDISEAVNIEENS